MRKKRIVLQIPVAYNVITSCVVTLREMEKKFFDNFKNCTEKSGIRKNVNVRGMLDEKRMEILYEILYAIDRGEFTDTRNDIFQYGSLIRKKRTYWQDRFFCVY